MPPIVSVFVVTSGVFPKVNLSGACVLLIVCCACAFIPSNELRCNSLVVGNVPLTPVLIEVLSGVVAVTALLALAVPVLTV